jgi:hypothetical protein
MDYVELEVGLHRREANTYSLEMRLSEPNSDGDIWLTGNTQPIIDIKLEEMRSLSGDDAEYGKKLAVKFLGHEAVKEAFKLAKGKAQTLKIPLRLRLFIGPTVPELHDLRWETMIDPLSDSPLLMSENVLFSRYISSLDARPLRLRPRTAMRALVVIANPKNLDNQQPNGRKLAPIDVDGELRRAKSSFANIPVTSLPPDKSSLPPGSNSVPPPSRATLENIITELRKGFDILYLVCHGALINGRPMLWLEDDEGNIANVAGRELVVKVRDMRQPPRLIVLASCQSAGKGDDARSDDAGSDDERSDDGGALSALGPRLAEAGVPAVIAMQGNVTMKTQAKFIQKLFEELDNKGQIDSAAAVARSSVSKQDDWWMPVLFMRLKSGRVWYTPGFYEKFEKWPMLLNRIKDGICVPILGPGLTDSLVGSRRELAQKLAEKYYYPMAYHQREELPQVAQFLAIKQKDPLFAPRSFLEYMCRAMLDLHGDEIEPELRALSPENASLDELVTAFDTLLDLVWRRRCQVNPAEPHKVLADLPFRMYVTTNPDRLMAKALSEAVIGGKKKEPRVEVCRWNDEIAELPSVRQLEPNYRPSKESPLIYHLFGRIEPPENLVDDDIEQTEFLKSLVLTEDNYFDFLIGATKNNDQIPTAVRKAFSAYSLLFLGFHLDDWNFRVLYRSIMSRQGRFAGADVPHVAVQIDPEEWRVQEPERAREFLQSYFQSAEISIYWGSADDFVEELRSYYKK